MTVVWWRQTIGPQLAQGDLLPECLLPLFPGDWNRGQPTEEFTFSARLIVMTQSCDLANRKTEHVALTRSHAPRGNARLRRSASSSEPFTPRSRYRIYEDRDPHFVTCTVVGWQPIFMRPETVEILLDSLRFLQRERGLQLFGYVIMENHLHLIAKADDLAERIGQFNRSPQRTRVCHPHCSLGRRGLRQQPPVADMPDERFRKCGTEKCL